MNNTDGPPRLLNLVDRVTNTPVCVIWEITLGCNLSCSHCGSRAGTKRTNELSLEDCKRTVDQLVELGTREICLIGGEVFIRRDWVSLVEYIKKKGLFCAIQTGGYKFPIEKLRQAFNYGLDGIGISIDGFRKEHDAIRGKIGAYFSAIQLLDYCNENAWTVSVNTQISSLNKESIVEFGRFLLTKKVKFWQLQLTVPMGNASDNFDLCLQPFQLPEVYERLSNAYDELADGGLLIIPGNNVGYFGPYEHMWRGPDRGGHYAGCVAGVNGMGIEADGTIKACPSLPKERYSCGNVLESNLRDIWHAPDAFVWNRQENARSYSGYCGECYYQATCKAGCTWMSDSLFGQPGNNPYCVYRVEQLKKRNIKEYIEKVEEADNFPFGTGKYRIVHKEEIDLEQ